MTWLYRLLPQSFRMRRALRAMGKLVPAKQNPALYVRAGYMRMPPAPMGQVLYLGHGTLSYVDADQLPVINPQLYVVTDATGQVWAKVLPKA